MDWNDMSSDEDDSWVNQDSDEETPKEEQKPPTTEVKPQENKNEDGDTKKQGKI